MTLVIGSLCAAIAAVLLLTWCVEYAFRWREAKRLKKGRK